MILVEREILFLSRALDSAMNTISRLQIARRQLQNKQTPVGRPPDDLISAILEEGNPRSISLTPKYTFLLSAICHHWRIIALQSPALWRYIRFHRSLTLKTTPPEKLYVLLERSQELRLDIMGWQGHVWLGVTG